MSVDSFKYTIMNSETNAIFIRRDTGRDRSGDNRFEIRKLSEKQKVEYTRIFFSWLNDYRQHSDNIGRVIYEEWGKPSVFPYYEYTSGRLAKRSPREPETSHIGLARRHLMSGYPQTWEFYKTGKAESVDICKEIEKIIAQYEEMIDRKMNIGNVLVREENIKSVPPRWDSQSHYDYHKVYDEIFKAGLYHYKQRELWIKSISDHTYLVAGYKLNPDDAGEILAYGKIQDMEELERQIHNLQLDNEIMDMVMHYHKKTEELAVNNYKARYFRDIRNIWREINEEGKLLKGHGACESLAECCVPP